MRAYVYEETAADQREPHDSGIEKSVDDLKRIGVLYWRFDGPDAVERLDALAAERNYKNRDQARQMQHTDQTPKARVIDKDPVLQIVVSPEVLGDVYESKVKMFFDE